MKKSYVTDNYILNKKEFCQKPVRRCYSLTTTPLLCQDPLRDEINCGYCSYYKTTGDTYIWRPCDYVKNVETEFYLRHGQNSHCCLQWKNRHNK